MDAHLKSYTSPTGAPRATPTYTDHKLDHNRALSTPEFCRADKPRRISGISHAPEINRQAGEHQKIDSLRGAVPGAERTVGRQALGLRPPGVIFDRVQFFHPGLKPGASQQGGGRQSR